MSGKDGKLFMMRSRKTEQGEEQRRARAANDPDKLLGMDWGERQEVLAGLEAGGSSWSTSGADQSAYDTVAGRLPERPWLPGARRPVRLRHLGRVPDGLGRARRARLSSPVRTPLPTVNNPDSEGFTVWDGSLSCPMLALPIT
jgi:hypothetical protein